MLIGEVSQTKRDILLALKSLESNVQGYRLEAREKQKHLEYRLSKAEGLGEKAHEALDQMSDQSKVQYIDELQAKIKDMRAKEQRTSEAHNQTKTERGKNRFALVLAIVSAFLAGVAGPLLVGWLSGQ
ncbi:MAG: hypothetical protein ACYTEQ_05340 [Planctomycetota bacterium]